MYIKAASYYIDGNDTGIWYAYFVIFDRRMFRPCSFLNVLHHSARCSRSYKCYIFEIRNDRSLHEILLFIEIFKNYQLYFRFV